MPAPADFETDLKLASLPLVLPANVKRVTPDGFPTRDLMNWEHFYREFAKDVTITQQTNFEALDEWIQEVEASADGSSASGLIRFTADADPTYANARFQLQVRASVGDAFADAGMEIVAEATLGGGATSGIGFMADQFYFADTADGEPVFEYVSGTFNFNVDVTIRNQDIAALAVSNQAFDTAGPTGGTPASFVEVDLDIRASARVMVVVSIFDTINALDALPQAGRISNFDFEVDNDTEGTLVVSWAHTSYTTSGGNVNSLSGEPLPATQTFLVQFGPGDAGSHNFRFNNAGGAGPYDIGMSIHVVEQADA